MKKQKHNHKVVRVFVKCLMNDKHAIATLIINKYNLAQNKEEFEIIIQHYCLILEAEKVLKRVEKDADVLIKNYFDR